MSYVYDLDVCSKKMPVGSFQSSLCTYVKFPNHPQCAHRHKRCDTELMKLVKTSNGTKVLYPHQVFCYRSVVSALQAMLEKPNFYKQCVSSGGSERFLQRPYQTFMMAVSGQNL